MYESEANFTILPQSEIPAEIAAQFGSPDRPVTWRTVLPWSEHCTECVWPACYSTCELYSPRPDGRCQRFDGGMVRVECPAAVNGYLLRIRFRQWAKLWSPGTFRLRKTAQARKREERDYRIGRILRGLPVPQPVRGFLAHLRYSFKKRMAAWQVGSRRLPTSFLVECYNPEQNTVPLSLTLRTRGSGSAIPYQAQLHMKPGFQRMRISAEEILAVLDARRPFDIELIPSHSEQLITLYFGLMDFVHEPVAVRGSVSTGASVRMVKCVVWDLDHTLWSGILAEDGLQGLVLRPGVQEILHTLDERGILQSVASKNHPEDAMAALRHFGIDHYFLFPEISWMPKSQGIRAIAQQLNIGLDSLLFVDDSPFEREEVSSVCREVSTLDAAEYLSLPDRAECQGAVTEESRQRRQLYQTDAERRNHAASFGDDYFAFLRDARIRIEISAMNEENLERVHELTQRTNRMNFSGNRYSRELLREILSDSSLDTYVLRCEDRFGAYGIIGFSVVDRRVPRMTDLMFSCRIQAKRVEHAFLTYLLRKYLAAQGRSFMVSYRRTGKNAPAAKVFTDFAMDELETTDGLTTLAFRAGRQIPDDGVVTVHEVETRTAEEILQ
jgi:FkbH-like protein